MVRQMRARVIGDRQSLPAESAWITTHGITSVKMLMVLTSHDRLGNADRKTGFWLEEFAAPYYAFRDVGVEMSPASPKGGQPPLDPKNDLPEKVRGHGPIVGSRG